MRAAEVGTVGARRRVASVLVVMLAVCGALEVGVRVIDDRLPEPLVWPSFEAQRKVDQMDQRAGQPVDVVFLGTSMMNAGVIPSLFVSTAGADISAYNASLSSGRPELMEFWSLHVVVPRLHPRLVVIGVTSGDINDNVSSDRAFLDAFSDSPGGLAALDRESALDRTDDWLRGHVALWRHRNELRDPSAVWDAVRGNTAAVDPVAASIDAEGHVTYRGDATFTPRPTEQGIAGVGNWTLGTEQPNALRRLIAGLQASGARVVLVQLPITEDFIDRHPRKGADYAQAKLAIADLARGANVDLLDLDGIRDHADFADEIHLNRKGATKFTVALVNAMRTSGELPSR